MTNPIHCPLCDDTETQLFFTSQDAVSEREFNRCRTCDLVFVPAVFHIDEQSQKERYLQHQNDPYGKDYRFFLSRLFDQLRPLLNPGSMGLDYGAGPGPALAAMMSEEGFDIQLYDLFFHSDKCVLKTLYDFVTCTETAEHFSSPREEFRKLFQLLRPGGWLGVMTGMLESWDDFANWYYHRDPTHVCFYSKKTMAWIGKEYSMTVLLPVQNVALFRKSN